MLLDVWILFNECFNVILYITFKKLNTHPFLCILCSFKPYCWNFLQTEWQIDRQINRTTTDIVMYRADIATKIVGMIAKTVATTFCLHCPRAAHILCSDQLMLTFFKYYEIISEQSGSRNFLNIQRLIYLPMFFLFLMIHINFVQTKAETTKPTVYHERYKRTMSLY